MIQLHWDYTNSMQASTKQQALLLQSMVVQQKKACEGSGYMAFLLGLLLSRLLQSLTFQPQLARPQLVSINSFLKVLLPSIF